MLRIKKGAGFLTFIAASCILGSEYVQEQQMFAAGTYLLLLALIAWVLVLYTFLSWAILSREKPWPETGLSGSWLLIIVSTQSLVILASSLVAHLPIDPGITFFLTVTAWMVGILFYVLLLSLLFYRLTFYAVTPSEITPDFWIDTGAAAISTLAGTSLINSAHSMPMFQQYIFFIKMPSLLMWGAATFWLPLLCIMETWRHVKSGFKYSPGYWSLVFPLGMYTMASIKVADVLQASFLNRLGQGFIYVALAAWLIIFIAMIYNIFKVFTPVPTAQQVMSD